MPDLREALLKEHLRSQRLGTIIRASLTSSVHHIVTSLKEETGRTYRDIFLIVLNIFKHHPDLFPIEREKKSREDLRFRISKTDSMTVLVWAWKRNQRRSNLIGDLMERFLELVPLSVFKDVLSNRKDQALRLEEDFRKHERTGKI
jgi:hypothetical protein